MSRFRRDSPLFSDFSQISLFAANLPTFCIEQSESEVELVSEFNSKVKDGDCFLQSLMCLRILATKGTISFWHFLHLALVFNFEPVFASTCKKCCQIASFLLPVIPVNKSIKTKNVRFKSRF